MSNESLAPQRRGGPKKRNPETLAMDKVLAAVDGLPHGTKLRVLGWAAESVAAEQSCCQATSKAPDAHDPCI